MNYFDLFWSINTALATALPVYVILILILDYLRTLLFYK